MTYSLIPESAPFTPEQRAWLNGFFAGWVGLEAANRLNGDLPAGVLDALPGPSAPAAAEPEETFPWHDPNLSIVERLEMAEGKPIERRLMAAMAQLDCGACGYVCKTYSEAIASGSEKNLTLCSPGGKNTAKAIKQLLKDGGSTNGNGAAKAATNGHAANGHAESGSTYHRNNPFLAKLKSSRNLNKAGSAKHTAHVVIDLAGSDLKYKVGDALGVYPTNPPELVDAILAATQLNADSIIAGANGEISLRDALRRQYCLRSSPEELMELLAQKAESEDERAAVSAALADESYENFDVLDALQLAPSAKVSEAEFLETLPPLAPRLYSIASSLRAHPEEVHLTVGRVSYEMNGRQRLGVASTMFADRVKEGDAVGVFIHTATDFTVPPDAGAPMIMVGPGTGIAPFRAFLEERHAGGAKGWNWLFFGDQCAASDFLYQEEFEAMRESGLLTRMDVAFSRDQEHKIYVQDRMRDEGEELFKWLEAGAYFFVCGDAKRMAADVDRALHEVIEKHGGKSADEAKEYVNRLKLQKRYVRDVY